MKDKFTDFLKNEQISTADWSASVLACKRPRGRNACYHLQYLNYQQVVRAPALKASEDACAPVKSFILSALIKPKLINYLFLLILAAFFSPNFFVAAQANPSGESQVFGSSLKTIGKKKKDKSKDEPPVVPLVAENIPADNDDEIIRVETSMVLNEILVFDEKGNPVKDLKIEDFIVKENDEPQEISTFISGDSEAIPRSVVLIIDYSGSQLPFIETSVEAAKVLIDKLNPNDRIAIVTDEVSLLQSFTNDKNLLKEKLESLKTRVSSGQVGPSKQYSALMATLNELFDDKTLRPIIIFQTDGDELAELKVKIFNPNPVNFSYKDILKATEKTQATIYSIIPGLCLNNSPEKERLEKVKAYFEMSQIAVAKFQNKPFKPGNRKIDSQFIKTRVDWLEKNESALREAAKFTGGSTKCLEQIEQAEQIYTEILSEMNRRYVIGYYPKNQVRDGKSRNVSTEIRGHPEYKIIARKTYILR
jgi:VWFA-related protein